MNIKKESNQKETISQYVIISSLIHGLSLMIWVKAQKLYQMISLEVKWSINLHTYCFTNKRILILKKKTLSMQFKYNL